MKSYIKVKINKRPSLDGVPIPTIGTERTDNKEILLWMDSKIVASAFFDEDGYTAITEDGLHTIKSRTLHEIGTIIYMLYRNKK